MRSKVLGLAIALSTFGLGVAATTAWVAYNAPDVPADSVSQPAVIAPLISPQTAAALPFKGAPCSAVTDSGFDWGSAPGHGVLQGKAISKPQPRYPAEAKAAGVYGTVIVRFVVDECGRVSQARAVSGHPLLRAAAEQAAYASRFSPTLQSGRPVKVGGSLPYNFVLQ